MPRFLCLLSEHAEEIALFLLSDLPLAVKCKLHSAPPGINAVIFGSNQMTAYTNGYLIACAQIVRNRRGEGDMAALLFPNTPLWRYALLAPPSPV